MHPNVHSSITYDSQDTHDTVTHTHTYTYMYTHKMEYYTAEKDNENCHLEQHGWT